MEASREHVTVAYAGDKHSINPAKIKKRVIIFPFIKNIERKKVKYYPVFLRSIPKH